MPVKPERLAPALQQIAAGPRPDDFFAVEYHQCAGTPSFWDERITFALHRTQSYCSVRNLVDVGNAPIGRWEAPADSARAQIIATAMCAAQIWNLRSTAVAPGEALIHWRYLTAAGSGEFSVTESAPQLMALSALDTELRELANDLKHAHAGAELRCELRLDATANNASVAIITLVNTGMRDALIANPFTQSHTEADYLRVELGYCPPDEPGVTGMGIEYRPVSAAPLPGLLTAAPWDSDYVLLRAGQRIECPLQVPVPQPQRVGHFVRAVYSNYGLESEIAGLPVLRGRAFSTELALGAQ